MNRTVLHSTAKHQKFTFVFLTFYSISHWGLEVNQFLVISPDGHIWSSLARFRQ